MKTNKSTFLIVLAALLAGAFALWMILKPAKTKEISEAEHARQVEVAEDVAHAAESAESPKSNFLLDMMKGWGSQPAPQPEAAPAESETPLAKLFDDPKMREELDKQMHIQAEALYGDFVEEMNLNPQDEQALKDLLYKRINAGKDIGIALVTGEKMSPEEMEEKQRALEAAKAESDKEIASLLGDEGGRSFEKYEKSVGERQQVKGVAAGFAAEGRVLSEAKQAQLRDALFNAHQGMDKLAGNLNLNDPEQMRKLADWARKANEEVLQNLPGYSPEELRLTRKLLNQGL